MERISRVPDSNEYLKLFAFHQVRSGVRYETMVLTALKIDAEHHL